MDRVTIQKILIADDSPDFLSAFADILKRHGFEVCMAQNSEEFEQVFFKQNPDLIILDIVMRGESGPDLYDRVMKMHSAPKVPVVFASGLVDPRSESPIVKGRQVAMYSKPINIAKLIQDIRVAFSDSVAA